MKYYCNNIKKNKLKLKAGEWKVGSVLGIYVKREIERMGSPNTPHVVESGASTSSLMDNMLGLLRIRVKKGINLAVRDVRSSDPYVVIKMAKQVLVSVSLVLDYYH